MTLPAAIGIGIAWFLVWLFAQAAFHKINAPGYYQELVQRYVPAMGGGRMWVAMVATLEAGIALSLLVPAWRAAGLIAAAALLLAYGALMASEMLRGRAGAQCGCAGPDSSLGVSWALVLRNGVCAALALLGLAGTATTDVNWMGFMLAAFLALFAALVYLTAEQIVSNAQWMAEEA
tara:strand:+ start:50306 stop:50836 length:531 start_codon:yes stop_codon:yes gene_type:complete